MALTALLPSALSTWFRPGAHCRQTPSTDERVPGPEGRDPGRQPPPRPSIPVCTIGLRNLMRFEAKSQALPVQSRHPGSCLCSKAPQMPAPQGARLSGKECSIPDIHGRQCHFSLTFPIGLWVPQTAGPRVQCFCPAVPQAVLGAVPPRSPCRRQKLAPSRCDSLASCFQRVNDTSWFIIHV